MLQSLSLSSQAVLGRELFPLALTPFESYLVWTDLPHYPKTFRIVQTFRGELDRTRLLDAFRLAIVRHPLLWARTVDKKGVLWWHLPDEVQFLFAEQGSFESSPFEATLRLNKESGLRFWFHNTAGNSELVSEYHHACCDGLGAQQFLQDWFLAYDQMSRGVPISRVQFTKLMIEHLLHRGSFERNQRTPADDHESLSLWKKLILAYRFHCQLPQPLVSNEATNETYLRLSIVGDRLRETDQFLEQCGLSLHEYSMAIVLRTLAEFQGNGSKKRIRVMFPTSHRSRQDRRASAVNRIGFAFVSSDCFECQSFESALQVARKQLQGIKRYSLGLDFVEQLGWAMKFSWFAKRLMTRPRCWSTAILTNLGHYGNRVQRLVPMEQEGFRVGNLLMTSASGVPPLQPKTEWGVGLTRQFDRICIGLRCRLGEPIAFELRDRVERQWLEPLG